MIDAIRHIVEKYRWRPEFDAITDLGVHSRGVDGDGLIHYAAADGSVEDVIALLRAGADVNMIGDIGNTPIQYAAMKGHNDVVQILLENRADLSIANEFGDTAISWALNCGHPETATLLKRWRRRT